MKTPDPSHLVDGKYAIGDLVNLDELRDIFEKFTRATGFTIGFLDHPGLNVLIATGWRDICTKFHRSCSASMEVCLKSNLSLPGKLSQPHQLIIEPCEHGLVDCATPIIIRGKHIASLATGQLLLEKPDRERFRRQARLYGFDEQEYLAALDEIPVVDPVQLRNVTVFLGSLAIVVSELGYSNLAMKEETTRLEEEIAERKRMGQALQASEEKYRALVETTGTGYVIVDINGIVIDANAEYVRLTGRSSLAEVVGRAVIEWTSPGDQERNAAAVRQCVDHGFIRNLEIDYQTPDGQHVPVLINASVLPSPQSSPRIVSLCRDITDRRQAEEERRKIEARMLHVQKLESLGVLAGGIAHDFNNLLMGILGNIDIALVDLPLSSAARAPLADAENAARRAADLCRQMLAYSGKGRFVVQQINLRELIEEMAQMLQVSISKKAVLRCAFDAHAPAVEADATQLRQVIMNLIINASESLGENEGVISVITGSMECDRRYLAGTHTTEELREGRYAYVEVSDTGCGMDDETKLRLFEPFFTTKFTGRGLGLSAVLGVIRGHKGAIKVYSEQGKGTTFKVLLPAIDRPAETLARATDVSGWHGSGTVLLVDDEDSVRVVARRMLEKMGFRVLQATHGQEAVELLQATETAGAERIVCVILDLTMPHMSGEEAFRELRRLRSDLPIILSSGFNEQDVTQRFVGKGLAGFIQKPYQTKDLAAKLRDVLENKTLPKQP